MSFPVRDRDRVLHIVSACDLGVLGGTRYPEQGDDLERSFRVLQKPPCRHLGDRRCPMVGPVPHSGRVH